MCRVFGAHVKYKWRSLAGTWLYGPDVPDRGLDFQQAHNRFFFFFTKYCRVIMKAVNFLVCTVKVGFPLMNW